MEKKEIAKRKAVVEHYRKRLSGVKGIKICPEQENVVSNYAYFPVIFDGYKYTRNEIFSKLGENNIVARKYFYPLTSDFSCYKEFSKGDTPIARKLAENVLCLPLFADLTIELVDVICNIILR